MRNFLTNALSTGTNKSRSWCFFQHSWRNLLICFRYDRYRHIAQMHGFFNMVNMLPGAAASMDYVVAEIDAALA